MDSAKCPDGFTYAKGVEKPWEEAINVTSRQEAPGVYILPLKQADGVICTQGNKNNAGSHAYLNTLYALDLSSPVKSSAGKVVAARRGIVQAVHNGCVAPSKSSDYRDDCGSGFGNSVVLLHKDGVMTGYAHLADVAVETGQRVEAGDILGTEGITGKAGHRHLHFSVFYNQHGSHGSPYPNFRTNPFVFLFRDAKGDVQTMKSTDLVCKYNVFDQDRWYRPTPEQLEALNRLETIEYKFELINDIICRLGLGAEFFYMAAKLYCEKAQLLKVVKEGTVADEQSEAGKQRKRAQEECVEGLKNVLNMLER
jgi:murein DD-endopeptidase MepM/ murein hydrolase activator NlpD